MSKELRRVPFEEFARDLTSFFDQVTRTGREIVVEREAGQLAIVKPLRATRRRGSAPSVADIEAFRSAAGSMRDLIDADKLKAEIYSARGSNRPAIEL